jgi:hypothetical protein
MKIMHVDYSTSSEVWTTKVDIFKHIPDSTFPNLSSMNQVPYLMEIHLTNDQTAMNDDNSPIIFKDTMICI